MYVIERHILVGNTDNISWLDNDGDFSELANASIFATYEDAERYCKPADDPNNRNPRVKEVRWEIKRFPYQKCPICGEDWSPDDFQLTHDCHGIPYRYVCPDCYDKVMEIGYDGEYYDELDECIDDEW